jgi:hypothetical protein
MTRILSFRLTYGVALALTCGYSTQPYGSTNKVPIQSLRVAPQVIVNP